MKRASDVPPVVESAGARPVTSLIAADDEIDERPGLGHERVGVRGLPVDVPAHALARRVGRAPLDQRLERSLAVAIVEADVEARARLAGNEVDDGIADVDRGELEIRRVKCALPWSSGVAISALISVTSPRTGLSARSG